MLVFYVSTRSIRIGDYLYGPDQQLERGFQGLDITYKLMSEDRTIDGRKLCEITVGANSSYTDQQCSDYKAIILEGLQAWSAHEKTLDSAKALADKLDGVSYDIVNGRLQYPVRS